jgi:hypothetical protein
MVVKIDALEDTQKILSESLIGLVKGIKEVKDDAIKEALDSRKDASELKDMMKILMNSNNHNNSSSTPQTQQTVNGQVIYGGTGTQSNVVNNGVTPSTTGTGTAKKIRKHYGKTPSSSPKEKEISSPDHRKQQ